VMERVTNVEMIFFIAVEGAGQMIHARVAGGSGADLMLRYWFERGSDVTKYCRKMRRSQRARLSSMGRKCDTT
jgi:hypothetical protein